MFSRLIIVAALLVGALGVLSCGLRTGEAPPGDTPIEFKGDRYSCVAQIADKVQQYIADELTEPEINKFVQCLQNAFISFAQLTHGSESGTYHPEELANFIEKNFLRDKKISPELLEEFMVIKQMYLGGNTDRVSRKDLSSAVAVLEDIRTEAIRMKPHIKVLNLGLLRTQDPDSLGVRLRDAQTALNLSIEVFSRRLENGQRDYGFIHMQKFLIHFRDFIDWEEHFEDSKPVDSWIEFVKIFKILNVAQDDTGISAKEWAPILKGFARWYVLGLQFEVGVKDRKIISGVGFENTKFLADQTFGLVEDAIRTQPNLLISFAQIERLVKAVRALDLLPQGVRPDSIMRMTRAVITRVFGDLSVPPDKRESNGLSMVTLAGMSAEVYRWIYIQMNLNQHYGGTQSRVSDGLEKTPELSPFVATKTLSSKMNHSRMVNRSRSSDWDSFIQVMTRMRPLYREGQPKVFLAHSTQLDRYKVRHSFYDLSILNLERSLVNLLFKGYSNDGTPDWDSRITEDQIEAFYQDLRDLGIDFRFIDKRKEQSGRRSFLEGNVFTYSSDGIHFDEKSGQPFMTLTETVELLAFMYSGSSLSVELYESLKLSCAERGPHEFPRDLYGAAKFDRECVEEQLTGAIIRLADNMPEMTASLSTLSEEKKLKFAQTLLATCYDPVNSSTKWVEYAEITTAAMVLHYEEVAMTRYDANHDSILDNTDVEGAATVFSGLIDKVTAKLKMNPLSEATKVAALKYILAYREIPSGNWDKFWLWMRDWTLGFPLSVDRMALGEVFQTIIQKLVAPEPVPAAAPKQPENCGRFGCSRP